IKGTQNNLLGKNTSLGAISIISRRPGDELSGYIQGDYEFEYESVYLTGAVNVPTGFGDFRLAINALEEEGYVDNRVTGNEIPEREALTARLSGAWDIGENGSLLVSYLYDDLEILGDTFQVDVDSTGLLDAMDPGTDVGIDDTKDAFTTLSDSGDAEDEQQSQRAIAQYDHALGDHQFTALSGWSKYRNDRLTDSDFIAADYLTTVYASDYEQFSQELRVTSPGNEAFDYVAGLYFLDSEMQFSTITDTAFPPPFTLGGLPLDGTSQRFYEQNTSVWSAFGQGTLNLGERWRATLGLRYTGEEKQAVFSRVRLRSGGPLADVIAEILAPVVPETGMQRSEDNLDGSINIQYDLGNDAMVFASWARGSKSGGFTTEVALPEDAEYDTEEAETTELGVKMNLAGGAALLNASVFYTEIDDFQIVTFIGTAFITESVPAESQGVEVEAAWVATEGLTIGMSATYADAEDKSVNQRLPYAPEWAASLSANYERPLADAGLLLRINGQLNYRDEQYMQREERSLDGELTLLDLRIALAAQDDRWEVALLGRNLLDQQTSFGFDFPAFGGREVPFGAATIGSMNRPRTLALQARYNL
ncbi:MAG: TonB-dependent receptor, partial [Halioglobus sp.]|nr:TonB-dependent receptor [Halioglobus sp.]